MTEKSEELDPKELECLMKVIEATPPVIEVMKICLNLQKEHGDIPVDKVIMRADEQSRATVYNALKWLEDNEFIYHKIGERGKYAFKKGWIDIFEKKVKDKRKTIDSGLEKIKELKKTIEIPWLPEEEISVIPGTLELISILANSFKDEDFKTVLIYTHFLPRIFITSLKSKKEILPFLRKKKFLSIIPTSLPEKPERKIEGLYEKIHEEVGVKLEYLQIPTKYPLIQRNTLICFLKHDLRDVVNKWKEWKEMENQKEKGELDENKFKNIMEKDFEQFFGKGRVILSGLGKKIKDIETYLEEEETVPDLPKVGVVFQSVKKRGNKERASLWVNFFVNLFLQLFFANKDKQSLKELLNLIYGDKKTEKEIDDIANTIKGV